MKQRTQKTAIWAGLASMVVAFLIAACSSIAPTVQASTLTPTNTLIGGGSGRLVFLGTRRGTNDMQICVVDIGLSDEHCLGNYPRLGVWGWYPDGIHLIVETDSDITSQRKFYSIDTITGDHVELTQFKNLSSVSFSPDLKYVAYTRHYSE